MIDEYNNDREVKKLIRNYKNRYRKNTIKIMTLMLNLDKIQHLAESYTPQEMFAALIWRRRFNDFDGGEVIADLIKNPKLWRSFLFGKPIHAPDRHCMSFLGVIDILLNLERSVKFPEPKDPPKDKTYCFYDPYPADTLYILAENEATIISQLIDLGKKWKADDVCVLDGAEETKENPYMKSRLKGALWEQGEKFESDGDRDAAIVVYWWD